MIQIVILVDPDPSARVGTDRRLEARAPAGYGVTELRCVRWSLSTKTGAVSLGISFELITPPDPSRG